MTTISYKTRPSDPANWHSLVAKASRFNPNDVDRKSIIGIAIYEGFYRNPVDTIEMIQEQIRDNSAAVRKVIGESNFNILNV